MVIVLNSRKSADTIWKILKKITRMLGSIVEPVVGEGKARYI